MTAESQLRPQQLHSARSSRRQERRYRPILLVVLQSKCLHLKHVRISLDFIDILFTVLTPTQHTERFGEDLGLDNLSLTDNEAYTL